jgi:hypothetical protein
MYVVEVIMGDLDKKKKEKEVKWGKLQNALTLGTLLLRVGKMKKKPKSLLSFVTRC